MTEFVRRTNPMPRLSRPLLPAVVLLAGLPVLGGCTSSGTFNFSNPFVATAAPPPAPAVQPPSIHADQIVGSWGYSAYHNEKDRARTQKAACTGKPYEIQASAAGGVMMLGHDSPQIQEMTLKGSVDGKTYIGPGTESGGMEDREVVSFDGKVLILKWVDPEVAGRYGNMMLVRCDGARTRTASAAKKRAADAPEQ
jgi:hypothetical protein